MALLQNQIQNLKEENSSPIKTSEKTTGELLFEEGLAPEQNIKGTRYDQKRQPRCFQFMLFSVYVNQWYLPGSNIDKYRADTFSFFKEKIKDSTKMLKEFKDGKHKKTFKIEED